MAGENVIEVLNGPRMSVRIIKNIVGKFIVQYEYRKAKPGIPAQWKAHWRDREHCYTYDDMKPAKAMMKAIHKRNN
jgi:hypothetical protein